MPRGRRIDHGLRCTQQSLLSYDSLSTRVIATAAPLSVAPSSAIAGNANRKSRIAGQPESYTIACVRACVRACIRRRRLWLWDYSWYKRVGGYKGEWWSTYSITHIGNTQTFQMSLTFQILTQTQKNPAYNLYYFLCKSWYFPDWSFYPLKTKIVRRSEVHPHSPAQITIFNFIYKL